MTATKKVSLFIAGLNAGAAALSVLDGSPWFAALNIVFCALNILGSRA